ncbi:MAG: hypothetical protein AAGI07_05155 [Bacteroidota bacterium]
MKVIEKISQIIFCILLLFSKVNAQERLEKQVEKSFPVEEGDLLDIENEYGKIIINTITGDSVKIAVLVKAEGKDTETTQETLDRVTFSMEKEGKVLTAHTNLDAKSSTIKSLAKSVGDAFKQTLTIDYEIGIPQGLEIDVYQKNGDIRIDEISTASKIELNDGELRLNKATAPLGITLKGATGTITSMKDGSLVMEKAEINIKEGGKLVLNSNVAGSKLDAGKLTNLHLESKNDEIECYELGGLTGKSTLSKIKVEKLYGDTNFKLSFGFLTVEKVTEEMESINVESKNSGDVFLDFANGIAFDLNVTGKTNSVELPEPTKGITKTNLDSKGREANWIGKVGEEGDRKVTLKSGSGGKIVLKW